MTLEASPYVAFRKDRRAARNLWEHFNAGVLDAEQPRTAYQQLLLAEWQRCKALGIDVAMSMGRRLAAEEFQCRLRCEGLLLDTALPIIRDVGDFLSDVPGIVMLTDAFGTVLHITGDGAVRERAATLSGIVEGSQWNEAAAGTNGIGTALARRQPVHVFAAEHFCEGWHGWTCAGAPIFDADGRTVLGVVDFTTIEADFRDQALGLSVSLANSIQSRLSLHREMERRRVLMTFSDAARRYPHDDLLAIDRGGQLIATSPNERCRQLGERSRRGDGHGEWQARETLPVIAPGTGEPIGAVLVLAKPSGYERVFRPDASAVAPEAPPEAQPAIGRFGDFVSRDPDTRRLLDELQRIAAADVNVLLVGETGTGKELLARQLHLASPRAAQPYIAANCGAIGEHLMESAFFGYVKGAFSGADPRGRAGYFESAGAGTLFLDEVGELPLPMQAALLRVLEDGSFQRVGTCASRRATCRIVAATNRDLEQSIAQGGFRSDLYFRLKVVQRSIKPLRERPCDITLMAERLAEAMRAKHGLAEAKLTPQALDALARYAWPGNIRELRNAIEAAVLCAQGAVELRHLPAEVQRGPDAQEVRQSAEAGDGLAAVRRYERQIIVEVLRKHPHVNQAAEALGIARSTLYRKFIELGIRQGEFVGTAAEGAISDEAGPAPSALR